MRISRDKLNKLAHTVADTLAETRRVRLSGGPEHDPAGGAQGAGEAADGRDEDRRGGAAEDRLAAEDHSEGSRSGTFFTASTTTMRSRSSGFRLWLYYFLGCFVGTPYPVSFAQNIHTIRLRSGPLFAEGLLPCGGEAGCGGLGRLILSSFQEQIWRKVYRIKRNLWVAFVFGAELICNSEVAYV